MNKPYRKFLPLLALGFSLSLGNLSASVTTDPVGYVTVTIEGGGKTSIISNAGLLKSASYKGAGSVSSGVLSVSGASFTVDEFASSHYVQFSNGSWSAISDNTATAITLDNPIADSADIGFTIRPLNTLDGLFGSNNSAGFTGGTNLAQADVIAIFDQATQNFAGLYYYNSSRTRWESSANAFSGGVIIYPDEALLVIGKSQKNIVFSGEVQEGITSGSLAGVGQSSLLPNPYPVDLLISESGFEDFLTGGANFAASDKVFIWDSANQLLSKFYYFDTDDSLWKTASNQVVTSSDVIPVGSAALIVKAQSGSATWSVEQSY